MGGKKKKSTGGVIKRDSKYKIPRVFDCPLCDAKAAIQIKPNKAKKEAQISCRVCGQPSPPYHAEYGPLTQNHDAFFEFYEWVRAKDAELLAQNNIVVQSIPQMHQDGFVTQALEAPQGAAPANTAPGQRRLAEEDDEIASLLA